MLFLYPVRIGIDYSWAYLHVIFTSIVHFIKKKLSFHKRIFGKLIIFNLSGVMEFILSKLYAVIIVLCIDTDLDNGHVKCKRPRPTAVV